MKGYLYGANHLVTSTTGCSIVIFRWRWPSGGTMAFNSWPCNNRGGPNSSHFNCFFSMVYAFDEATLSCHLPATVMRTTVYHIYQHEDKFFVPHKFFAWRNSLFSSITQYLTKCYKLNSVPALVSGHLQTYLHNTHTSSWPWALSLTVSCNAYHISSSHPPLSSSTSRCWSISTFSAAQRRSSIHSSQFCLRR